jgi:hypothetical protein
MKTVVLVGMGAPWEVDPEGRHEVWGVNKTYLKTPEEYHDRVYFFDRLFNTEDQTQEMREEFVRRLNDMPIRVLARQHYPEIPASERYPTEDVMRYFHMCDQEGNPDLKKAYFTSTITWMMAHAIYEGFETIILHRIYSMPGSFEYFGQKGCMEFFCGHALGRGIRILISSDSHLMRPFPWQSGLYGYIEQESEWTAQQMLASTAKAVMRLDRHFSWNPEMTLLQGTDPIAAVKDVPAWDDTKDEDQAA